ILGLILLPRETFSQQKDLAITIYNNNLGLVRDVRVLRLERGVTEYTFQDVAAQIDPTSVYFKSITAPDDVLILEQNFEYDLVNSSKILQKYVDQSVTLSGKDGTNYSGTLLNASGGDVILQEADGGIKIVSRATVENMAFPKLPQGLITRPSLVWSLDCRRSGDHEIEVGYLTEGVQWHAEYVGLTDESDKRLELSGWVSIDNKSGATYENAKLKLVAGDVHRAQPEIRRFRAFQALEKAVPDQFEEKSFFEYHLYTLQRPATLANNQIKQISLFEAVRLPVSKKYTYAGQRDRKNIRVNLEFKNEKSRGLGFPLPKGKVRIYKQDEDESLIFVGEDFVQHTPRDEDVRMYVGHAFDIVGERIQKNRRAIGKESWEETWEIKLRNRKTEDVVITVVEHLNFEWEILRSSPEFSKKDASTVEFVVPVPKDGEVVVEYVVRYNR
ncbi:DUF4139 domain-containing protein, partial [bacterium]|nr:DUF4139 domain-containing protein [bacterium]